MNQYRHASHTTAQLPQSGYPQSHAPYQQQQQQQQHQMPPMHGQQSWFNAAIVAPQASHPAAPPPVQSHTPPVQTEEWDDSYLSVLATQDLRQLRELLARSNPEVTMPLNSAPPLSQAVILTLVHRVRLLAFLDDPLPNHFFSSLALLEKRRLLTNRSNQRCGGCKGLLPSSTLVYVKSPSIVSGTDGHPFPGSSDLSLRRASGSQCPADAEHHQTTVGDSPWGSTLDGGRPYYFRCPGCT
jgi:hypothetical protein